LRSPLQPLELFSIIRAVDLPAEKRFAQRRQAAEGIKADEPADVLEPGVFVSRSRLLTNRVSRFGYRQLKKAGCQVEDLATNV
jgi:hypothetical protein